MKIKAKDNAHVKEFGVTSTPAATGGDLAFAQVLIAAGMVTRAVVDPLLQRLPAERAAATQNGQTLTLLQLLTNEKVAKLDDLLSVSIKQSGLPYLPLATYDVDRDIACLLPREIAFEFCLVPFDRISRCVLIAITNPMDKAIRERVRGLLGCDLFWYVSAPAEITNALRQAHGLNNDRRADTHNPKQ